MPDLTERKKDSQFCSRILENNSVCCHVRMSGCHKERDWWVLYPPRLVTEFIPSLKDKSAPFILCCVDDAEVCDDKNCGSYWQLYYYWGLITKTASLPWPHPANPPCKIVECCGDNQLTMTIIKPPESNS